jgi:hypothetical protein
MYHACTLNWIEIILYSIKCVCKFHFQLLEYNFRFLSSDLWRYIFPFRKPPQVVLIIWEKKSLGSLCGTVLHLGRIAYFLQMTHILMKSMHAKSCIWQSFQLNSVNLNRILKTLLPCLFSLAVMTKIRTKLWVVTPARVILRLYCTLFRQNFFFNLLLSRQ